ncbi:S41 family peptidase [Christiangramia sp. LLG6405-1]|uniref:S41 family peptidase n=1 Tax=Christiangramia sp. LLG6405-1 TaxID=3160832 RepID=UPI003869F2AB
MAITTMYMKNYQVLILLLFCSTISKGQELHTSQDSIRTFFGELIQTMKDGYVYKDEVNWKDVETELNGNLNEYSDFSSSLKEIPLLFDLTKADHSTLYYKELQISGNFKTPSINDFSEQWAKKYKTNPGFEVKLIGNNYGYILMPGITDVNSPKSIRRLAQQMYDEINNLKSQKDVKGWIIDLRFNTGGNCEPMLLAFYDFLGDNDIWGVLGKDRRLQSMISLNNGKYNYDGKNQGRIKPTGELLINSKVAVITNNATGSSGEIVALAFKPRSNTILIGEPTNGKTTSNVKANLPFGAFMTLSVGLDSDRNGRYYERIIPDINITKEDNFDNLLLDGNISEAIKFISEHE